MSHRHTCYKIEKNHPYVCICVSKVSFNSAPEEFDLINIFEKIYSVVQNPKKLNLHN